MTNKDRPNFVTFLHSSVRSASKGLLKGRRCVDAHQSSDLFMAGASSQLRRSQIRAFFERKCKERWKC